MFVDISQLSQNIYNWVEDGVFFILLNSLGLTSTHIIDLFVSNFQVLAILRRENLNKWNIKYKTPKAREKILKYKKKKSK